MPVVSIIVPCFNQGQYLRGALDSIFSQSYDQWECIIVNDSSTDETELVAKSYIKKDNRFKYIKTAGIGVSAVRNEGIKVASGQYILPLDGDDKIAPIYLEKAIEAFRKFPDLSLVYGEAEFFGERSGVWNLPNYNYYDLLFNNLMYCSAIFKREDFNKIGGYSTEMVHGLEDWDLWLRLLNKKSKVLKLPEVVFYYRIKSLSRSTELLKEGKMAQTRKQLLNRNLDIYNDYLFKILEDLSNCKSEKIRIEKQLISLKNSRTHKIVSLLKSVANKFKFNL
ncbi:glycosyltransferase family 2 protein [Pontibacter populi]|uniref:Glycosyltransferase n=1 Tax=Pontibacter populi TaxID=890055 RepID=A0ABV1RV78_9BACT